MDDIKVSDYVMNMDFCITIYRGAKSPEIKKVSKIKKIIENINDDIRI